MPFSEIRQTDRMRPQTGVNMKKDRDSRMLAFHTRIHAREAGEPLCRFLEKGLAPLGFNTLILELNPGYTYRCFPEFSTGTLCKEDIRRILQCCREYGIRLLPLFQCLSHQSDYGGKPWPLYQKHPHLLERPGVPYNAKWPEIYCHSWCCSKKEIYDYIFPMLDEVIEDFETDTVHIGMDEVFDIGEDDCPECRGKDKALLFAETVKTIHEHLEQKGVRTLMWGDRLLDASKMHYQMWEADRFGIYKAMEDRERISRQIGITDWHYDRHPHGYPSVDRFLEEGFTVFPSVFMDPEQAGHMLGYMVEAEYIAEKLHYPGKIGGVLCTHWDAFDEERMQHLLKGIRQEDPDDNNTSYFVGQVLAKVSELCTRNRA